MGICIGKKPKRETLTLKINTNKSRKRKTPSLSQISKMRKTNPQKTELQDNYIIKSVLGTGNLGVVRKGVNILTKTQVAIKSINKHKLKGQKAQILRQIQILLSVDHPNIIKIQSLYQDEKYIHYVMKLCSGGQLYEKVIREGYISQQKASVYMTQILRAVHHIHLMGICHRDLKPENFIFQTNNPDSQIKMIDFGISNKFGDKFGKTQTMQSFVGTPYYVAPQVIKGEYDLRCDQWSIGVILFVMLSGNLPFSGNNEMEIFRNIVRGQIVIQGGRWQTVSQQAKDLVTKLLKFNPEERITAEIALQHPWIVNSINPEFRIDEGILKSLSEFSRRSKMKELAISTMMQFLTENQLKELRESFVALDENQDGHLSIKEISKALREADLELPDGQIEVLFQNLNYQNTGMVNYTEFISATLESKVEIDEQLLWWTFQVFDADSSGFITVENLREMFLKLGRDVEEDFLEQIIQEVDLQQEGKINFEEFKVIMAKQV